MAIVMERGWSMPRCGCVSRQMNRFSPSPQQKAETRTGIISYLTVLSEDTLGGAMLEDEAVDLSLGVFACLDNL